MKQTYDQFTQRVMTTRSGKIKDIDAVARGRIFSAKEAKDLGMVDEIGGVESAVAYAAAQTDLRPGEYDVRVLPPPRTLADMFNQDADSASDDDSDSILPIRPKISLNAPTELTAFLAALPAPLRHSVGEQLQILMLLQQRPVILASPFTLVVR